MEQLSLFNYLKPNYGESRDEIVRAHIEYEFQKMVPLSTCCGKTPQEMFRSCHEYFVKCSICGRRTKYFRHLYEAKQAWNKEEYEIEL